MTLTTVSWRQIQSSGVVAILDLLSTIITRAIIFNVMPYCSECNKVSHFETKMGCTFPGWNGTLRNTQVPQKRNLKESGELLHISVQTRHIS